MLFSKSISQFLGKVLLENSMVCPFSETSICEKVLVHNTIGCFYSIDDFICVLGLFEN
jgi:hypothetical protein